MLIFILLDLYLWSRKHYHITHSEFGGLASIHLEIPNSEAFSSVEGELSEALNAKFLARRPAKVVAKLNK